MNIFGMIGICSKFSPYQYHKEPYHVTTLWSNHELVADNAILDYKINNT